MKIGITFDLREDYGIDRNSQVFADFCHPDEIGYMIDLGCDGVITNRPDVGLEVSRQKEHEK